MTLRQLLGSIDARELAEWEAYERAFGPLGPAYQNEMLAKIVEHLSVGNFLAGQQLEENPIPEPEHIDRPDELYVLEMLPPEDDDEDSYYEAVRASGPAPTEDDDDVMTEAEFSALFDD